MPADAKSTGGCGETPGDTDLLVSREEDCHTQPCVRGHVKLPQVRGGKQLRHDFLAPESNPSKMHLVRSSDGKHNLRDMILLDSKMAPRDEISLAELGWVESKIANPCMRDSSAPERANDDVAVFEAFP